ncbi:right-handed parallel beta-helix repeat-containing protein [Candidatus Fermentibacteria bacterium]|nr:right-handed parallel beta-helix repeat-containing protein [Candidatus Fermentibacteria bacterium]
MRYRVFLSALIPVAAWAVPLTDGMEIRGSTVVSPGTYVISQPIRVVEDGAILDLAGVVLRSSQADRAADEFDGVAVVAEGVRDVRIANAAIRGFKVGILARACTSLVIQGCDVSENYRQRLHSTPVRENLVDWLWPHHNDEDEWMTNYGAGIYLDRCLGVVVEGNTGHDGQNGIILSRTDSSFVYDNDMSFMSGWGLGMWRSCSNEVSRNRFDYCVRGYSHDLYRRGQDSAGILVFEQCSDNVFAFNSATHGGDGFFLYAGHETLERTGTGGSNRNLLYGNDFSHAVANGIEATFSDGNRFIANTMDECEYGIWAGYSYNTDIVENVISRCARAGIAIEHGHDNWIEGNIFEANRVGVLLWAFSNAHFDSLPFGRAQNTRSERYRILRNRFQADSTSIRLDNSVDIRIEENEFNPLQTSLTVRSVCPALSFRRNTVLGGTLSVNNEAREPVRLGANFTIVHDFEGEVVITDSLTAAPEADSSGFQRSLPPPPVRGTGDAFLSPDRVRGRQSIVISDWGPVDVSLPHLFPLASAAWGTGTVFITGPPGYFNVGLVTGPVFVEPLAGRIPAEIVVTPHRQGFVTTTLQIDLAGEPVDCQISLASAPWRVRFFGWERSGPDDLPKDWSAVIAAPPLDSLLVDAVDFWWGGKAPTDAVPAERFATVCETSINLPTGTYAAHTISDDGVRLFVNDAPVITNWTPHFAREDRGVFTVGTGTHRFRVEHCQIDGSSWLQVWIDR